MTEVLNDQNILKLASQIAGDDVREIAVTGIKAAVVAGRFAMKQYGRPIKISYKGEIDLVTEVDMGSERLIKDKIAGVADAEIMAEESSADSHLRDGRFWIVDPLDGTTNFAHGFPFFAPSIAFCRIERGIFTPVFGCVFIPLMNELFWAVRGAGSYLNTSAIKISHAERLGASLLATGFPYDVHQHPDDVVAALKEMLIRAQGIRRAGAAAIDLVYVACGRLDGFWEKNLKPWDTAAGQLILQEAGGRLSNFSGNEYNPFIPEIIASNGIIHDDMVDVLRNFSA